MMMDHVTSASPAVRPGALLSRAGRFALRLLRNWQHRRQVSRLLDLEDHMLADIGVSRSEVAGALAAPYLDDPSWRLVEARQERRRNRGRRGR